MQEKFVMSHNGVVVKMNNWEVIELVGDSWAFYVFVFSNWVYGLLKIFLKKLQWY